MTTTPEPRRGPSPGQIRRRRAVALVLVAAAVVAAIAAVAVALPHTHTAAPTITVLPPPPKPFRIVFPEGFTRAQMVERVQAVAKIAERKKKGKKVALARVAYARATRTLTVPCFAPRKRTKVE